ncbi:MAG: elongation factor G, partial [Lachnospiraceae bacterium]|nr:elongation factor G [Lachnospiraceae bacterium]
ALQKIMQEDLTVKVENDAENHQTLLYGISEQHLEVIQEALEEKYKVSIELTKPKIAYKETILGKSDVEYKHKKQSGGHGQYGHVKMTFEPSGNLEEAYEFSQTVVGGAVPKNFFPAVEKGIAEASEAGPLAAYPVVGVKANLYDGSYHPVDSSENSFKVAARMALKQGMMQAHPILLEPIALLKVVVSDAYTGDVMGDLNKRRARVNGMNAIGGDKQEVVAEIPYAELYGYGTILRSMTGGTGDFSYEFLKYQQAPKEVQDAEVERRASKVAEGEEV